MPIPLLFSWFIFSSLSLLSRPLLPVDETRYLSVAWEMWQRADFLVPYLNGEPYAHKPPLLFWLIHLSWSIFGVNEWSARWLFSILGLIALALTIKLARLIKLSQPENSAWILFSFGLWLSLYSLVQFDILLVLAQLIALIALIRISQGQINDWWLYGLGLGFGLLAKGPVILLHSLPIALLAPLWTQQNWRLWYLRLGLSLLLGLAMVLAWAIPAALRGGEAYAQAIFWGQTAKRVVDSFAHQQPWYWYFIWLPFWLLPWSMMIRRGSIPLFLWLIIISTLVLFSLVSGKQARYLLPLLPVIAIAGLPLIRIASASILIYGLFGSALIFILPHLPVKAVWWVQLQWAWGLLSLVATLILWRIPASPIIRLASLQMILFLVLQAQIMSAARPAYDLHPLAQKIAKLQKQGYQIAHFGKYHGQYHFLGRLHQPLIPVSSQNIVTWAQQHPQDYMIYYAKQGCANPYALWRQDYRSRAQALMLIRAQDYLKQPCA